MVPLWWSHPKNTSVNTPIHIPYNLENKPTSNISQDFGEKKLEISRPQK